MVRKSLEEEMKKLNDELNAIKEQEDSANLEMAQTKQQLHLELQERESQVLSLKEKCKDIIFVSLVPLHFSISVVEMMS